MHINGISKEAADEEFIFVGTVLLAMVGDKCRCKTHRAQRAHALKSLLWLMQIATPLGDEVEDEDDDGHGFEPEEEEGQVYSFSTEVDGNGNLLTPFPDDLPEQVRRSLEKIIAERVGRGKHGG